MHSADCGMLSGEWRLESACSAVHLLDYISPGGCHFPTCLKVLYRFAVVVSKSKPSPPFPATPGISSGKVEQVGERESAKRGPQEDIICSIIKLAHVDMWKRLTKQLFLQEVWGRCQWGGAREFGWRQSRRLSVMRAVAPAHPWHVSGIEGAQWVGQLACIPGRLALPLALPPTAFLQLDCSG